MSAVGNRPRNAHALPPAAGVRRRRGQFGRDGHRSGAELRPRDRDRRKAVVLRCPGPLVALRALAALYGVSAQRLAACLADCEMHNIDARAPATAALRSTVSDRLSSAPLTPTAVHYFHATRLRNPQLVLEHGLQPSPTTPDAIWLRLGELAENDIPPARWAALQPLPDARRNGPHARLLQAADALDRGPRGSLVCDVLLRPALYGAQDHLTVPSLVQDLAAACEPSLGFDLALRCTQATTPCIVEYRRRPARSGQDIEAALWFVAAALRGAVSPSAVGGHDAHGALIAAHDIVSVRAVGTQTEWTAQQSPR